MWVISVLGAQYLPKNDIPNFRGSYEVLSLEIYEDSLIL